MGGRPFGPSGHALLSDRHSAALVAHDGSVVWLCFPRFDIESVFASILDDDAGHWSIRPTAPSTSTRSCVDGTMALPTTFHTDEGTLKLRNASFTMKAPWVAACPDEAHEFFDFMTAAAEHSRPERHLQIVLGIGRRT